MGRADNINTLTTMKLVENGVDEDDVFPWEETEALMRDNETILLDVRQIERSTVYYCISIIRGARVRSVLHR